MLWKFQIRKKIQETAFNLSCDTELDGFMRFYKECTNEPHSFLVHETTLSFDTILHFRNNLIKNYFNVNVKKNYDH